MLVAKQKRKENIAEYILYMYQVEDLIRAFNFDMNLIQDNLIVRYQADEETKVEIIKWYDNLLLMMKKESIVNKGHLQFLNNQIRELNEFHLKLLEVGKDKIYLNHFQSNVIIVEELKQKNKTAGNDIQVSLDAIYGYLLLKMQNKKVEESTVDAIKNISNWLGALSRLFKDYESGELEF